MDNQNSPVPPTSSDAEAERLCATIERGRPSPVSLKFEIPPELETEVSEFARAQRARGMLAERVVVEVKRIVHNCVDTWLGYREQESLLGAVVRWTIRAYYGANGASKKSDATS